LESGEGDIRRKQLRQRFIGCAADKATVDDFLISCERDEHYSSKKDNAGHGSRSYQPIAG
jgi:hypothetical protein